MISHCDIRGGVLSAVSGLVRAYAGLLSIEVDGGWRRRLLDDGPFTEFQRLIHGEVALPIVLGYRGTKINASAEECKLHDGPTWSTVTILYNVRREHIGQNARETHELMLIREMQIGGNITFPFDFTQGCVGPARQMKTFQCLKDLKPSMSI